MKNVIEILKMVENTSSTKEKENILKLNKDNELLKKVLYYTYNPNLKYGISESTAVTITGWESKFTDIWDMLGTLARSNINNDLRYHTGAFLCKIDNKDEWQLYIRMLLKDLRCNISAKTVNKVWKGLIPTHEIMLASKFEGTLDRKKGKVAVTTKVDGLRVSAIVDKTKGEVQWLTRQGKEVLGLNQLTKAILEMALCNCFIDGELLAMNEEELNSGELFRKTTKIANSKLEDKTGLRFIMFDYLGMTEYENKKCIIPYCERRFELRGQLDRYFNLGDGVKLLDVVEHHTVTDNEEEIYALLTKVCSEGEEGLMLNYMQGMYEFKRSKNILKVKEFFTADLKVMSLEEGTGRNKGRLGALVVDYKDYTVKVGSGFSDEQRELIWGERFLSKSIIGKVVEVRYFEESGNQKGGISLRFPTFVMIREEGKEVSYH